MKYNETVNDHERKAKIDYIDSKWRGYQESVSLSLNRINNYLFVVNSGALLGALSYLANNPDRHKCLIFSVWCFLGGLSLSVIHATIDYYSLRYDFQRYQKKVSLYYESKLDWEEVVNKSNSLINADKILQAIGVLSGGLALLGLVYGIINL